MAEMDFEEMLIFAKDLFERRKVPCISTVIGLNEADIIRLSVQVLCDKTIRNITGSEYTVLCSVVGATSTKNKQLL